jgi:hypothetical protein
VGVGNAVDTTGTADGAVLVGNTCTIAGNVVYTRGGFEVTGADGAGELPGVLPGAGKRNDPPGEVGKTGVGKTGLPKNVIAMTPVKNSGQ